MDPLMVKTLETCIPALSKSLAEKLMQTASKKVQEGWNKAKVNWGSAFDAYLQKAQERNSKMKTLLYRHEPKPLYEFYEFVDLKQKNKVIHSRHVEDVLALGRNLIITGVGGIGKTVMLKHFFLDSILAYEQNGHVPVLVELRGLNGKTAANVDVLDFIYSTMRQHGFKLARQYFNYSMEQGCYLILLDAFDELKEELRQEVTAQIQNMANSYPDNFIILSSRPNAGEFVGWHNFLELESKPLNKKQAVSLVKKIDTKYHDKAKKQGFLKELRGEMFERYESFVSCPLLLTIMFLVYKNAASMPTQLVDFYEQAFHTLYQEHDSSKAGNYKREFKCKELGFSQFKDLFAHFCFKSYIDNTFEFNHTDLLTRLRDSKQKTSFEGAWTEEDFLTDLLSAVCMLVKDGLVYRFTHRSFQEFFAAYYITKLDDDTQKKIFMLEHDEARRIGHSLSYMLMSIQKDRFEKNFTYPLLKNFNETSLRVTPDELYSMHIQDIVIGNDDWDSFMPAVVFLIDGSKKLCRAFSFDIHHVASIICDKEREYLHGILRSMTPESFSDFIQKARQWVDDYEARQVKDNDPRKVLEAL